MEKINTEELSKYIILETGDNLVKGLDGYIIRYFQIGKFVNDKFYGIVYDYIGSGQFQEFYFCEGKDIYEILETSEDDLDIGINEVIEYLDNSGIIESSTIYDFLNQFSTENFDFGTQLFIIDNLDNFENINGYNYFINNNIDNPIIVGNTKF